MAKLSILEHRDYIGMVDNRKNRFKVRNSKIVEGPKC